MKTVKATRLDVLLKAREYIGTPYVHQGRAKGAGVDCCGLIICVARDLELSTFDIDGYSRTPPIKTFLKHFQETCTETKAPMPGDIAIFRIRHQIHCGIIGNRAYQATLIHAYQTVAKVTEHGLDPTWSNLALTYFKFPQIP
jgi:hypothetical protein